MIPSSNSQEGAQEKKNQSVSLGWAAATVVSCISFALASLGYGVALSVETQFGVPHAQLFSSVMELIELSVWAVIGIVDAVDRTPMINILELMAGGFVRVFLIVFVVWVILVFFGRWWKRVLQGNTRNWQSFREKFSPAILNGKSIRHEIGLGVFYSAIAGLGGSLAAFILGLAMVAFLLFGALLPIIGMGAGSKHIRNYVIEPENCAPLFNRINRQKVASGQDATVVANCVEIEKDEKVLGRGRVVFSTSSAVILWNPLIGSVGRIPTEGAVVRVIASLPDGKKKT